jgi:AcrR family transcriptional regulator
LNGHFKAGEEMPSRPKLTQQRRLQTLDAAVEVISEKGLADTRVADIAERAGLSPGLLLYYFRSKDDLLTEALTYAEDRFYLDTFHELSEIPDPRRRLIRLIVLSCPTDPATGDLDDWPLWIELWARAMHYPEAARKREALDRRWRNTISDIVRAGQEQGHFATEVDADDFALRLAALMDGLALQMVLKDTAVTTGKMRDLCIDTATQRLRFELRAEEDLVPAGEGGHQA